MDSDRVQISQGCEVCVIELVCCIILFDNGIVMTNELERYRHFVAECVVHWKKAHFSLCSVIQL